MPDFVLPIFPFDSAAITVSTTVWVGVCVCVFFNLRLGWTLSGLVVPGYLVPLLMTRPISAGVIFFEAILTYMIVLWMSEKFNRLPYWSSFFGRDRFFIILIVSVLLRAVLDGFLLPWVGKLAVDHYSINIDYRSNLHSFGLIVVALIANYFWKPGLLRGLPPLATCVALTYLITQYVLVGFTNFNISNFHALYEDITTSLMSSPKSYIILIATAYLASWINLRYAWDFNGILIPALLGLLWHDPMKILISGFECILLCIVGSLVMRVPPFRNMAIEGGRKTTFFFTICFVYRLLVCHLMPHVAPDLQVTDMFGYGYLLTTLMAIKIHDKKHYLRILRATGEVSLIGAVVGSLIGFAFYCGPRIDFGFDSAVATMVQTNARPEVRHADALVQDLVRADKILLYEKQRRESYQAPLPAELRTFATSLRRLKELGRDLRPDKLNAIAIQLNAANFELSVISNRYLYLREKSPANGWGIFVIDTHQSEGLCLEVPAPMDEWGSVETGLVLFRDLPSSSLAIAGTSRRINFGRAADVTRQRQTIFQAFHQVFGHENVLQVRGFTNETAHAISEAESLSAGDSGKIATQSRLYVRGSIPEQLNLSQLKSFTTGLDVRWNYSPTTNCLRTDTKSCFAELILSYSDRRELFRKIADSRTAAGTRIAGIDVVQQPLANWMRQVKENIINQGTDLYIPAKTEEMLFMDREVVAPLLQVMSQIGADPDDSSDSYLSLRPEWLTDEVSRYLVPIDTSARALGYRITVIQDPEYRESFVVLSEVNSAEQRGWGTFVLRPGLIDGIAIEVPRPLFERRSFDFGMNLFHRPRCSVLMVAGTHPRANRDGSADISKTANRTNLVNLVRHVLLRHLGDRPYLIAQARAIQAPVDADIVVATDDGTRDLDNMSPLKTQLLSQLTDDHFDVAFVTGHRETAGYELGILMQATAIQISQHKEVVSLWLSPSLRTRFREQAENYTLAAQFHTCKIPTENVNLLGYLLESYATVPVDNRQPIPAELRSALQQYVLTNDVVRLYRITQSFPAWRFTRLLDRASGQAYLLIENETAGLPSVLNLTGSVSEKSIAMNGLDHETVTAYIRSRARWLTPAANDPADADVNSSMPAEALRSDVTRQSSYDGGGAQ